MLHEWRSAGSHMTKLKTVKDIPDGDRYGAFRGAYVKDLIKKEAIKWVKEYKDFNGFEATRFKQFHNITEEDLK